MSGRTLIIAEAGVNHNGSLDMARALVDAAAEAGVDYVKFQTFRAENLVTRHAPKAAYQARNEGDGGQFEMLKRLELRPEDHRGLMDYCALRNVKFLSTAFDLESVAFLETLGLGLWKIPSGELTNFPYLRAIGRTAKPVILSTGMARMEEIGEAIDVLTRFGTPREGITLLHCTTEYPAPKDEANLVAMRQMRERFRLPVGYSDHTEGIEIPVAAVALGACVVEKHFTLDRSLPGPDHKASLEPEELRQMVVAIRSVETALGDGVKGPSASEAGNVNIARKSIVAAMDISKGQIFTEANITSKRPGGGISPMEWERVVGTRAVRDFAADEAIEI